MTRPLGSKNRPKMITKAVDKYVETVDNVLRGTFCKECQHEKKMHYDGLKGHCNTKDCVCLEFLC